MEIFINKSKPNNACKGIEIAKDEKYKMMKK